MKKRYKIMTGWLLITIAYLIVFMVFGMFVSYDSSIGVTNFVKSPWLKPVLGVLLTIIPYMLAGFYCRKAFKGESWQIPFLVGLIPCLGEKILIFISSAMIYSINPFSVTKQP